MLSVNIQAYAVAVAAKRYEIIEASTYNLNPSVGMG